MSSIIRPLPQADDDRLYPETDGKPVGETDWHMMALIWLRITLEELYERQDDVKVASDMFLYYVEGDPSKSKAPDIMIIKGVSKHWRRTFKTWVERAMPCVIIEIVSDRTIDEDQGEKRALYERLGVTEYFLFDPEGKYMNPPLQGFRLRGKKYVALRRNADGRLSSKEIGMDLRIEDRYKLRLIDPATGKPFLLRSERTQEAERRTEQAAQRIAALEAELARLRSEHTQRKGKKS